jgi:hypothetical protein
MNMAETALQVLSYNEVKALAADVAKSRLFPAFGNPEQAMVLMMVAQAEGCHPITATQRYDVIQGKPAKKSDAMLADFQRRGGKVAWLELTDKAVEAEFMANGLSRPVKVRWTMDMAIAAKLTGKDNWKNYPRQMLRARVVSEGIRISDPGVVAGLYTPEEVQDFTPSPYTSAPAESKPGKPGEVIVASAEDVEVLPPVETTTPAPAISPERTKAIKSLVIAIKTAGVVEADRKAWMSEKLGRAVESSKDLTDDEIAMLHKAATNG